MRVEKVKVDNYENWDLCVFDNLKDFYDYICNTPLNETFRWATLSSSKTSDNNWSGTSSFDEASNLLKNGWDAGAKELTQKFKTITTKEVDVEYKNFLSMCGYQAIVPLYLNGVPNNMINKKLTPVKKKVITINKVISCSAAVSSETMKQEAIKCFQIIRKIEQMGVRVNLNLLMSSGHACVKIPLKKSTEKISIAKMAFPLVHPSMFRRLFFRFIETYPTYPSSYKIGYGRVPDESKFKACCKKDEILLPTLLRGHTEEEIERLSVDDLINRLK